MDITEIPSSDVSTFVIAVFTILLASFSLWQTMITRRSARQQVRAYIGIHSGSVRIVNDNEGALISINFTNTGQSPAYSFSTWMKAKVDKPAAIPFGDELSISDRSGNSVFVPGAGADCSLLHRLSPQELQELRDGTKLLFIWGGADYRDAFNKKRHFKLRSQAGVNGSNVWAIQPHKIGYLAN